MKKTILNDLVCFMLILTVVLGCQGVNGTVKLRYADGGSGPAIQDVTVDFNPLEGQASIATGLTDAQGHYEFETASGPHMVHAYHPDYDYFTAGPVDVPEGQTLTYDIFLQEKAADLVLITTSLLPQTGALLEAIEAYKQAAFDNEGLVVHLVILDSDACEYVYGLKLAYPGVYWNWKDTRTVIQAIQAVTGASYFVILGGREVVSRPRYNPNSLPEGEEPPFSNIFRSDGMYIDFDDDFITEEGLVISRMPSLEGESDSVIKALQTATELHIAGGHTLETQVIFGGDAYPAPPFGMCPDCEEKDEFISLLNSSDEIFFWGHGKHCQVYNWDLTASIISVCFGDSTDFIDFDDDHPIAYAWGPCHAGALNHPMNLGSDAPSLALTFMTKGAGAYIAKASSSGYTADMIEDFHTGFNQGDRIGDALFTAMRTSALDPDPEHADFKFYAIQYQLYGDPALRKK